MTSNAISLRLLAFSSGQIVGEMGTLALLNVPPQAQIMSPLDTDGPARGAGMAGQETKNKLNGVFTGGIS